MCEVKSATVYISLNYICVRSFINDFYIQLSNDSIQILNNIQIASQDNTSHNIFASD